MELKEKEIEIEKELQYYEEWSRSISGFVRMQILIVLYLYVQDTVLHHQHGDSNLSMRAL